MNLRVDLILVSERRSANVINLKLVRTVLCIAVPLLIALFLALSIVDLMNLDKRQNLVEEQWKTNAPKKEKALKVRQRVQRSLRTLNEIEGWSRSHIDWHAQLEALQKAVPAQVQLTSLRLSQTLQLVEAQKKPARVFEIAIEGRDATAGAERDVQALKRSLAEASTGTVSDVEIAKFEADPKNKTERVFELVSRYFPRKFISE